MSGTDRNSEAQKAQEILNNAVHFRSAQGIAMSAAKGEGIDSYDSIRAVTDNQAVPNVQFDLPVYEETRDYSTSETQKSAQHGDTMKKYIPIAVAAVAVVAISAVSFLVNKKDK